MADNGHAVSDRCSIANSTSQSARGRHYGQWGGEWGLYTLKSSGTAYLPVNTCCTYISSTGFIIILKSMLGLLMYTPVCGV